jgi:hypothetical protein
MDPWENVMPNVLPTAREMLIITARLWDDGRHRVKAKLFLIPQTKTETVCSIYLPSSSRHRPYKTFAEATSQHNPSCLTRAEPYYLQETYSQSPGGSAGACFARACNPQSDRTISSRDIHKKPSQKFGTHKFFCTTRCR